MKMLSKPQIVDELVDYYFFRRLAAPLIPWLARFGLTPNQVTAGGLGLGLITGWLFHRGHSVLAALCLMGTVVLDCADGMLARHLGQTDPFGRILDGLSDTIWLVAVMLGLATSPELAGVSGQFLGPLAVATTVSMILHCGQYDRIKTQYLLTCETGFTERYLSREEIVNRCREAWRRGSVVMGSIYFLVLAHDIVFPHRVERAEGPATEARKFELRERLKGPMRLWSFLGESSHIVFIIVCALLTPLYREAYLGIGWVIVGPFNLLWIWAALSWRRQWQGMTPTSERP